MSSFAECKSCGYTIRWARTPKGKNMPVDPTPGQTGNVRLKGNGRTDIAYVLSGHALEAARQSKEALYTSHFATCAAWGRRFFPRR